MGQEGPEPYQKPRNRSGASDDRSGARLVGRSTGTGLGAVFACAPVLSLVGLAPSDLDYPRRIHVAARNEEPPNAQSTAISGPD